FSNLLELGGLLISILITEFTEPLSALSQNTTEIYSLHVDCKVTSWFAHTAITSRVVNTTNASKETLFETEFPETAFISSFTTPMNGRHSKLMHVCAINYFLVSRSTGRKLKQFHVTDNMAAAANVTFELICEELLKQKLGKHGLLIKVEPKQLAKDFQVNSWQRILPKVS
uniref:VIT domain-containing protein n=1 Tax=Varanus komodoensis TaxID=61221 RepID=A0A8D2KV28_VARKO